VASVLTLFLFGCSFTARLASEENNATRIESLDDFPSHLFQQLRIVHVQHL